MIKKYPLFFILSLLSSVLLFMALSFLLSLLPGLFLPSAQNSSVSPFIFKDMEYPQDNFEGLLYILGFIFIPVISFFLYKWLVGLEGQNKKISYPKLYWLIAVMGVIYVYLNYYWLYYYVSTYGFSLLSFSLLTLLGLAVVFRQSYDTARYQSKMIFAAVIALILLTSLTQINTAGSLIADYSALFHFSNIMGVTNQIHHGHTILVNTTSLYGIAYPYIALFFTKIAGYSILSLSLFFVLLIFLSYLFLYLALGSISGYRSWFTLLMFLALLGMSHPYYNAVHLNEEIFKILRAYGPYYQYHPIRVIFCAFFIWFALQYRKQENRLTYGAGMSLAALSVFWNFDSGLAIICAWLGFLIYLDLAKKDIPFTKNVVLAGKHLAVLALCLVSLAAAYSLFAYFRAHSFPVWSNLFAFHKLFLEYGFFMLPMNPFDLWHLQIWIYMAVLVSSLLKLWQKESTDRDAYYFFLAVLGLILFRYYVGRSVIFNLYPGSYPAVIILALALQELSTRYHPADYTISNFKRSNLFRFDVLKIVVCLILVNYGLVVFAYHGQDLKYHLGKSWQLLRHSGSTEEVAATVKYINQTKKSDKIFIFSSLSEYLHLQTSTSSPLPYSCLNEIFTEAQAQQIKEMLEHKEIKQVYLILKSRSAKGKGFVSLANLVIPAIERYYCQVHKEQLNRELTVVLFEPKQATER